jgi:hypothetical protein
MDKPDEMGMAFGQSGSISKQPYYLRYKQEHFWVGKFYVNELCIAALQITLCNASLIHWMVISDAEQPLLSSRLEQCSILIGACFNSRAKIDLKFLGENLCQKKSQVLNMLYGTVYPPPNNA